MYTQLKKANIDLKDIRHIFITHRHLDHITGMLWILRSVVYPSRYEGVLHVYANEEVIAILKENLKLLFTPIEANRAIDRIQFDVVHDGDRRIILGHRFTFFDIGSVYVYQYGFSMEISEGKKLVCLGDEPYHECEESYVKDADWLFHEAFCRYADCEVFRPYNKGHSTVKDACELAERMRVKNLVLYHTEETHLRERKTLYTEEGQQYYSGNLYVPDDLDTLKIR